jgi:hypothetical protein
MAAAVFIDMELRVDLLRFKNERLRLSVGSEAFWIFTRFSFRGSAMLRTYPHGSFGPLSLKAQDQSNSAHKVQRIFRKSERNALRQQGAQ